MGGDWLDVNVAEKSAALTVDQSVYSVEAVMRTAYWFTDRAYVFISAPAEHALRVHLKLKPASLESPRQDAISDIAGEFSNALLDNQLRESVEQRTGRIRELLVMKALAEAGIAEDMPPGSPNDTVADQQQVNLIQISSGG